MVGKLVMYFTALWDKVTHDKRGLRVIPRARMRARGQAGKQERVLYRAISGVWLSYYSIFFNGIWAQQCAVQRDEQLFSTQKRGVGFTRARGGSGGELERDKKEGQSSNSTHFVVAEDMDYDAKAIAQPMPPSVIAELVSGLDRAELVKLRNLDTD